MLRKSGGKNTDNLARIRLINIFAFHGQSTIFVSCQQTENYHVVSRAFGDSNSHSFCMRNYVKYDTYGHASHFPHVI